MANTIHQNRSERHRSSWMRAVLSRLGAAALLLCGFLAAPNGASAATRLIVRTQALSILKTTCLLSGCVVQYGLGDPQGQLFLVTSPLDLPIHLFLGISGVLEVEADQTGRTMDAVAQGPVPSALYDSAPVSYYGATVRRGYVEQPAAGIVRLAQAQIEFTAAGAGTVAVIDTGVDTGHPALQGVLLPGYDFTRNRSGADERGDVTQSTTAVVDGTGTAVVDQSTTAVIDGSRAETLNQPRYQAFGHGTMVAGVVHLIAPKALILPLKAFNADGTGYASDVIRAIYYAAARRANVLNMSFSFTSPSFALNTALAYASLNGAIAAASAGNSGQQTLVYPAAWRSLVMGVASTSNDDALSTFSNYGQKLVWVGAPGEGIITLYPYSSYAAAWGTSFSTPIVSGAAALLLDLQPSFRQSQAADAVAHAKYVSEALGNGRLDIYQALEAAIR